MTDRHDVAIIGGGIVGLATAYQMLRRRPGLNLVVVEKDHEVALHQSGRNSGVVHAGLYYRPGSLKARLCREGKVELERFVAEHDVPYRRCGKLIVAVRPGELRGLTSLLDRARANGVPGIEDVPGERIGEFEPHAVGLRAIRSAGTGIVDFRGVAMALAKEIRSRGARVATGCRVRAIGRRGPWRTLVTGGGSIRARCVIACAGLHSDRVASMTGDRPALRIVPFRGSYLRLRPPAGDLVRGLIYPVPDPTVPFLGVHFTPRVDGEVWVGPNAVLALAREGYSAGRISPGDLRDVLGFGGFWRLAARHAAAGAAESARAAFRPIMARELRRYVPGVRAADLAAGPSGVRAQAVDGRGRLVDDFVIAGAEGVVHVLNAPSPAATAALAIGRVIGERAERWLDAG